MSVLDVAAEGTDGIEVGVDGKVEGVEGALVVPLGVDTGALEDASSTLTLRIASI